MSIDRKLGETWDALAADNSDDHWRVTHLNTAADLFDQFADHDEATRDTDRLTAVLLRALVDADLLARGQRTQWYMTLPTLTGEIREALGRIASEPDLARRALLLEDLWKAIPDDGAAETIACLPYAPGMVAWRHEEGLPSTVSFRAFLKAAGAVWRSRRAA